ncbi:hypothetical protein ACFQU7_30475 [Pseudoroseomonas wenyumeiae]
MLLAVGTEDPLPLLGRLRRQLDALTTLGGVQAGGAALAAATADAAALLPHLADLAMRLEAFNLVTRSEVTDPTLRGRRQGARGRRYRRRPGS